jgi:hypothetical protein
MHGNGALFYPSSEEGVLFFSFLLFLWWAINQWLRLGLLGVCVYTWQGGRDLNGYKSLLLKHYFSFLFLSALFPASLPFFLFCMVRGHWHLVLRLNQKAYEKLAFFSSFLSALVSFGTAEYT